MTDENDDKTETTRDTCIRRPRVDRVLSEAIKNPLVYIIAGAGYGKTRAVEMFFKELRNSSVYWIQLSESDNIVSWHWEHATHIIGQDNPELALMLREFGFPDTKSRFRRYMTEVRKHNLPLKHKLFVVLDDFHLITNRQILDYYERCALSFIPNACMVFISRKEPDINVMPLYSKSMLGIVDEDVLRFTQEEIADFFNHQSVKFSHKNLPVLFDKTQGWALAIRLLSLVLKRKPGDEPSAFEAMKQGIFKLMEREAFTDFSLKNQKTLLQLALVPDMPINFLKKLVGDNAFFDTNPNVASFVNFKGHFGSFWVHPMYLDFLISKGHLLLDAEKTGIYRLAADYCTKHDLNIDALTYLAKLEDYSKILRLLTSYPIAMTRDTTEYFLFVLKGLDLNNTNSDNHILKIIRIIFIPRLLFELGRYEEAERLTSEAIDKIRLEGGDKADILLFGCYINLGYISLQTCLSSLKYDFPQYFEKAFMHHEKSYIKPMDTGIRFGNAYSCADIDSFASLIGKNAERHHLDEFLDAARRTVAVVPKMLWGLCAGYDDLVACELAFYGAQYTSCKRYAYKAIAKARENNQYAIEAMASFYMMRVAMMDGDFTLASGLLQEQKERLKHYWNGQALYDVIASFFYLRIGLPDYVALWLKYDPGHIMSSFSIKEMEVLAHANYLISVKKYYEGAAVLQQMTDANEYEQFLFCEIARHIALAVCFLNTRDTGEASAHLYEAWRLSFDGEFEAPFIEVGKFMCQLADIELKRADSKIPRDWLVSISRKASAYSKKIASIAAAVKASHSVAESIKLSDREEQVLTDLYHGLSRSEIATIRYLSINTVKSILHSLYTKLGAANNVDAVRIAIEKKLIH